MNNTASVLVVDDDLGVRGAIEATLTGEAYRLSFATSGVEAIAMAKESVPDVILLDIMMPGMDGFEVCRHLRTDPILAQVPIIMVTALNDRQSLLKALQAGADEFIVKPFDRLELRARVQTAARLNRFQQLVAERTKFEWVVERANDGYLLTGDDGQIVYANPRAQLYLGLETVEIGSGSTPGTFLEIARRQYQCEPVHVWSKWAIVPAAAIERPLYLVQAESVHSPAFWLEVDVLGIPGQSMAARLICLRDVSIQISTARQQWAFDWAMTNRWHAPLSNIVSSLELLASTNGELTLAQATSGIGIALQAVRRLDSEIQQVLEYVSCSGVIRQFAVSAMADVPDLVAELGRRLKLRPANVQIRRDLARSTLPLSRQVLELVLGELLQKMQRLHPDSDSAIEVQAVHEKPGQVMIRIVDDGVNLSPTELLHFWTPGYPDGKWSTIPRSGGGLGLSMVASLLWESGGSIAARNCQDQPGLCIEIMLPLAKTPNL